MQKIALGSKTIRTIGGKNEKHLGFATMWPHEERHSILELLLEDPIFMRSLESFGPRQCTSINDGGSMENF